MKRIGFACKLSQLDPKKGVVSIPEFNTKTTTVAWLNRQTRDAAVEKLWDLMTHNIESIKNLINHVGSLEPHLKMVRLSSDILPVYTEKNWSWFWKQTEVVNYCEQEFGRAGAIAREKDVRLSFHPGQFCVLASENPSVVERSIEEFEYHATMAKWMGFGKSFQDFKINVHISGRRGPAGIIDAVKSLSSEARNCITIENEENTWGLDDCLDLADICPIVLDVHHFWCREGQYIQPDDKKYQHVIESWRGVRPVIHYSYSRDENFPPGFEHNCLPDMKLLLDMGCKKQRLRAHSECYPNQSVNDYALSFLDTADIMSEVKQKNLASFKLAAQAKEKGYI
jgi:UV DNA damage endonuclease